MAKPEKVAFLGLGIMGSRMAANLCRAGFEVHAWNRTRARAEELAAAHGASSPTRRPRPPRRRASRSRWSWTRRRSRRCCSARTAPPRGSARAVWRSTCPRSRPAPAVRSPNRSGDRGIALPRRAGDGIEAEGRGRNADDHGWRRGRRLRASAAAVRGDGEAGAARGPARARLDGEADQQHGRRGQHGRGCGGDRARPRGRARP